MMMSPKNWRIAAKAPPGHLPQFPHLHPFLVQILYNRGITEPERVSAFLDTDSARVNPFALQGVNDAVTRIRRALRAGERIAVYGDFDADGVTATALLVETLQALGADVQPYIPDRHSEGYGLKKEPLTVMARTGVDLVITVDCGIRAWEQIAHAGRLGLHVIVTDHHSLGCQLPPAVAVINPWRDSAASPSRQRWSDGLSGAGVAYQLARALLLSNRQSPVSDREVLLEEDHLLDLVALGTVADVVPLLGENRALVRRGLERINAMERVGIRALCQKAGLKPGNADAGAIGYVLGPRLNAAGRIAHARSAYRLLITEDADEAAELADLLNTLNRQRQEVTRAAQEKARWMVRDTVDSACLLFAAAPDFRAGIAGLVASRLTDEFYRPSVVVSVGKTLSRGSARSIAEFDIAEALERCQDLLVRHGGHAAAGGFTVANDQLDPLAHRLSQIAADQLGDQELRPTLSVDAEVELSSMSWDLCNELARLEPCGYGNDRPLFVSRSAHVCHHRAVGRESRHLKLRVSDGSAAWDAIAFRQGEWAGRLPDVVDLAYHLEINEWNGQRQLQLNVQDIRPATADTSVVP